MRWLSTLLVAIPLRFKVLSIALVTLLGFVTFFVINFLLVRQNEIRLTNISEVNYPVLERANANMDLLEKIFDALKMAVATNEMDLVEKSDGYHQSIIDNIAAMSKLQPEFTEYNGNVQKTVDDYYGQARALSVGMIKRDISLEDLPARATSINEKLELTRNTLHGFRESMLSLFTHTLEEAKIQEIAALRYSIGIGFFATLTIVLASLIVVKAVTGDVLNVANSLHTLATGEGDLTLRIQSHGNDEIGTLVNNLNAFMEKMHSMMQMLAKMAIELGAAAGQMSNTADQVDSSVNSQQKEITQIATAITQMAATIHSVSETATRTSETANATNELAINGKNTVSEALHSISRLAEDVGLVGAAIQNLAQQSDRIGGVVDTINGISEQTNLLALNAAIEAARAGDQGRGFAVVADEVRTLATRTQSATKEIQDMIGILQIGARDAVASIQSGINQSKATQGQAETAGQALNNITQAVSKINDMNLQVASATEQQSAVAQEIEKMTAHISDLAADTRTRARAAANAGGGLLKLAEDLQTLAGRYKI